MITEICKYAPWKEMLDDFKKRNSEEYHEIYGFTPCMVDTELVMFHRWCDYSDSTMPNEYRSSQGLMGIVEFPNGIIAKIPASKITFIKHIRFDFDKEDDKISKNKRM